MRTRIRSLGCIAAAIVVVCGLATLTHAAEVTLRVFSPASSTEALVTCGPFTSTTNTVALPATCGPFQITKQTGSIQAEVAALPGDSQNQLVVRTTVIRNGGTTTARLEIDATHTFILTAP